MSCRLQCKGIGLGLEALALQSLRVSNGTRFSRSASTDVGYKAEKAAEVGSHIY